MVSATKRQQLVVAGFAAAATISLLYYWYSTSSNKEKVKAKSSSKYHQDKKVSSSRGVAPSKTPPPPTGADSTPNIRRSQRESLNDKTPLVKNTTKQDEKALHAKIEDLDKKGKALFKNKQVRYFLLMVGSYSCWRCCSSHSLLILSYPTVQPHVVSASRRSLYRSTRSH